MWDAKSTGDSGQGLIHRGVDVTLLDESESAASATMRKKLSHANIKRYFSNWNDHRWNTVSKNQ